MKTGRINWSKSACGAHVCKVKGEEGYAGRVITRVIDRDLKTGRGRTVYVGYLACGENVGEFKSLQSAKWEVEDTYLDEKLQSEDWCE